MENRIILQMDQAAFKDQIFLGTIRKCRKNSGWIAVSVYVLVAIAKKKFMLQQSLYEILQILSISIFEKMSINQLFQQNQKQYFKELNHNQLRMFDYIKTLVIQINL